MPTMSLQIGQQAPLFSSTSDDGKVVDLQALRGKWVFLFFYPRANSAGCSIEAQRIEGILPQLQQLGVQIVGISTDTEANQALFRDRCSISYPLLPDRDKKISQDYGVLSGIGKLLGMTGRQSFLIDPEGKIAHLWRFVNPMTHASEVLKKVESVTSG